jgi:hypothetical protein
MLIRDISVTECCDLLKRVGFGRLACARKNQPYILPVYFVYEPDHLFGFSTVGRKIEWMRTNPLVCVEADEILGPDNWVSVVVFGLYEELPDIPKFAALRLHAQSLLEKRARWWQLAVASSQTREDPLPPLPILYSIHIQEMTGHRASPDTAGPPVGGAGQNHQVQ